MPLFSSWLLRRILVPVDRTQAPGLMRAETSYPSLDVGRRWRSAADVVVGVLQRPRTGPEPFAIVSVISGVNQTFGGGLPLIFGIDRRWWGGPDRRYGIGDLVRASPV